MIDAPIFKSLFAGDSTPSYRDPMPYTEAVLKEVLRIINLTPMLFPHR